MPGHYDSGSSSCSKWPNDRMAAVVKHKAIPFFIYTLVWKGCSFGVCRKRFPKESGTETVFPRGSGKVFQRGHISKDKPSSEVIPRKLVSYGPFLVLPHRISGPKVNVENCPPYPCMAKKWNTPLLAPGMRRRRLQRKMTKGYYWIGVEENIGMFSKS